jgi:hypothetical protein
MSDDVWGIDAKTFKPVAKIKVQDGPRSFGTFIRKTP